MYVTKSGILGHILFVFFMNHDKEGKWNFKLVEIAGSTASYLQLSLSHPKMIQTVPLNALLASWLPLFLSHPKVKIIILECYISLKTVLKCFVNLIT